MNQENLEIFRQAALDGGADQHEADLICSVIQAVDTQARVQVDGMLRTHLGITLEELEALDLLHKNGAKSSVSFYKVWMRKHVMRPKLRAKGW